MVDFLISYQNNIAKIGRVKNRITTENSERILTEDNDYLSYIPELVEIFKVKSFDTPPAILTENNNFLMTENGAFLVWDDSEDDSLVYRFLAADILPSPEIDTDRILYGDY